MQKELEIKLKIMKLYGYFILNHRLSIDEITELYIEYLKLSVCLGTNDPVFDENFDKYKRVNCYCYALGITYPKLFAERYYNIEIDDFGHNLCFISQSNYPRTTSERIDNLYKDLETLNIKFYETDVNSENKHGGYKIAIYSAPSDFHVIRQNSDGLWSEKLGYSSCFLQMDEPRAIKDCYELVKTLEIVQPVVK